MDDALTLRAERLGQPKVVVVVVGAGPLVGALIGKLHRDHGVAARCGGRCQASPGICAGGDVACWHSRLRLQPRHDPFAEVQVPPVVTARDSDRSFCIRDIRGHQYAGFRRSVGLTQALRPAAGPRHVLNVSRPLPVIYKADHVRRPNLLVIRCRARPSGTRKHPRGQTFPGPVPRISRRHDGFNGPEHPSQRGPSPRVTVRDRHLRVSRLLI
jgi:hypothetical protein